MSPPGAGGRHNKNCYLREEAYDVVAQGIQLTHDVEEEGVCVVVQRLVVEE